MKYTQSIMRYAQKYGVSKASRVYNRTRSFIYFWLSRYDGTVESLACYSRKPLSHPNQHTPSELKLIADMRRRNPTLGLVEFWCRLRERGYQRSLGGLHRVMQRQGYGMEGKVKQTYTPKPYEAMQYPGQRVQIDVKVVPTACRAGDCPKLYQYTAIDEFSRLRYLGAYQEHSAYSSADFLARVVAYYGRLGIKVECVQTDNGAEFTKRLTSPKTHNPTFFEKTAAQLGIRHKLIKPYTPRHNGKVERSHREDQKRFYNHRSFYSLDDFSYQLARYLPRSNNIPMRPLGFLSPSAFLRQVSVHFV